MRKTILFLLDGLLGGGAERVVITLAMGMLEQGHDVTLISLRPDARYPVPAGVHYFVLEKDTYRGPFRRQTEIKRRARALDVLLAQIFLGRKIDLTISNLFITDRIVAASHYLKNPWFCIHATMSVELKRMNKVRAWRKKRLLLKTYFGKRLITVSQELQKDVLALGIQPALLTTIYNPFDIEKIRSASLEKSAFEGDSFLLHVGRWHLQKRHDRLFEAFKISGYTGKLLLLGEGTAEEKKILQEQAVKQGIADRVIFAGFVANPYAVMRAAEALVLSSDYEGLPSVLIEALICGTQVVSTNCPYGPAEILRGRLAQGLADLTAPSLAAAIERTLATPVTITDAMLAPFALSESVRRYLELIGKK